MQKLKQIMTCIDFKTTLPYSGSQYLRGAKHEPRSNYLLTGHGLLSATSIQIMRQSLSRRSSRPQLHLSRSVLLHGFRSTHRTRVAARYRSLSASPRPQAVSCRPEGPRIAQYPGQGQRSTQLENQQRSYFIIRAKNNLAFSRIASRPVDKTRGLCSDQTIRLTGPKSSAYYPERLRRVHYVDTELGKRFFFLTNNFQLSPRTIARLYKCRWLIELFFKWIKQHLRIKTFYGTTPNAVKTQVWIAISVYVLVAIVKKELGLQAGMYEILQILSVTLFEKTPLKSLFSGHLSNFSQGNLYNQLSLFDF